MEEKICGLLCTKIWSMENILGCPHSQRSALSYQSDSFQYSQEAKAAPLAHKCCGQWALLQPYL